ncbi:MAG: dTMP kinase, partial [Candidatus Micrarchaeia archaeon]
MFIVFEGIDGAGKTIQAKILYERLNGMGVKASLTKEPTDGPVGKLIRKNASGVAGSFIKVEKKIAKKDIDGTLVNQFAMQALFVSDRLYHIEQFIEPELAAGHVVISDRYMLSTIAYGMAAGISRKWLVTLNRGLIEPDITLLLDLDVKTALERIGARRSTKELFEKAEFLSRVR